MLSELKTSRKLVGMKQIRRALQELHLPEADWFMERLLPAFECNLDELERIEA